MNDLDNQVSYEGVNFMVLGALMVHMESTGYAESMAKESYELWWIVRQTCNK